MCTIKVKVMVLVLTRMMGSSGSVRCVTFAFFREDRVEQEVRRSDVPGQGRVHGEPRLDPRRRTTKGSRIRKRIPSQKQAVEEILESQDCSRVEARNPQPRLYVSEKTF